LKRVNRHQIVLIAWPIILSNLSTPLLGIVDTAVIGNLGNPALIGAIAIGSIIFSFVYWGFGFLRMGTTGLVAQAFGASNSTEASAAFYRAALLGIILGFMILAFQYPLAVLSFELFSGSQEVESNARIYFDIRIWTAPISLCHLAIIGFLLGQQDTRSVLLIQLVLNGTNIALDLLFVTGFSWSVSGVAWATVISEVLAFSLGIFIISSRLERKISITDLFNFEKLRIMLAVNRDIMVRTLCLIFAFAWFTNKGAQFGDITLAANAILMQLVTFSAFFLDGFALTAETLVGAAVGERNKEKLDTTIRLCTQLGLGTAIMLSLLYWFTGTWFISLMSNVDSVRLEAGEYLIWVILAPVLSVWCYLLDGIFIGATRTVEMRNAMIISLISFLGAWYLSDLILWQAAKNHGLWVSLLIYFIIRALALNYYLPRLRRLESYGGKS